MFVRKLVEKASKKPGGNSDSLKGGEIDPRVVFHCGIPSGSNTLAYDSIQKILAVSTKDGRIKLFGRDNTQALLESINAVPSKFLQFVENHGILLNVNSKNHIEVWDLEKNMLAHVHAFHEDITSFKVMQQSLYIYVGDSVGNVSVLKLEQESCHIVQMKYTIPYPASHGNSTEVLSDTAVMYIMPQPTAESKRVLIIFRDGPIVLWDIRESKTIFTAGVNTLSVHQDTKKVSAACWACPSGSKVVVGYNNGEIFIWSIPSTPNPSDISHSTPICKLNLGYKLEKIPIASLRWVYADGKASRVYVMGASDIISSNLLQVILLNEHTEGRTIRLGLQLPEPCINMEIISSVSSEQIKHQQDCFLVLSDSGNLYAYDDSSIEKYLLQSQSKSSSSLPKEVMLKMPFIDSSITVSKFITDDTNMLTNTDEEYLLLAKSIPSLLSSETKPKDGSHFSTARFSGFSKVKNLYITGHSDGGINFWDLSCPILVPIFSLKQQSEEDLSLSSTPLTALCFDGKSRILVSGDQNGTVRIFRFKPEPYANVSSFLSLQGSTKKGNDHIIQSLRLMKINGSVLSLNMNHSTRHLAVGSSKGNVLVIDIEGPSVLYDNHIASEISTGIISLQFETCSFHGFDKNVLAVATEDSSVLALDSDNGNTLSTSLVHPKKPTRALFMKILDGSTAEDSSKKSLLLLCSEKAAYIYSFSHVMQGVKKVIHKKKFQSSCCWASTFDISSGVGVILVFTCGKIEIRSLPELSMTKETSVRGFTYSTSKTNSYTDTSICSSPEGELVLVNTDQEIFLFSLSLQKQRFRLLNFLSSTYQKDLIVSQEELAARVIPKEKKKGMFSSVIKDIVGSKPKNVPEMEIEDTKESFQELSTIFSTANFKVDAENRDDNQAMDEDDDQLDIDDIEIDIPGEKPKEQNMLAALNTDKLASKFLAFKGKVLKQMKTTKSEKNSPKEEKPEEMVDSVDEIKKRYGFSSSETANVAKLAESKLQENTRKLQGINLKTTEMQDTARTFSSLAKQVLRTEQDRRAS